MISFLRMIAVVALAAALAPSAGASVRGGIESKMPHLVAVKAFGAPLVPGEATIPLDDPRRMLIAISSVKLLPVTSAAARVTGVLSEPGPVLRELFPYLPVLLALFLLSLLARRKVRLAMIPPPRRRRRRG